MKDKLIIFLLKILDPKRSEIRWWDDLSTGNKSLVITFSDYDMISMSPRKMLRVQHLIESLMLEWREL